MTRSLLDYNLTTDDNIQNTLVEQCKYQRWKSKNLIKIVAMLI